MTISGPSCALGAAEHDVLRASFTAEGDLSYDVDARPFFTYRFLSEGETEEDVARAVASAEAAARTALERRGWGTSCAARRCRTSLRRP